jgi:hypothetical protein
MRTRVLLASTRMKRPPPLRQLLLPDLHYAVRTGDVAGPRAAPCSSARSSRHARAHRMVASEHDGVEAQRKKAARALFRLLARLGSGPGLRRAGLEGTAGRRAGTCIALRVLARFPPAGPTCTRVCARPVCRARRAPDAPAGPPAGSRRDMTYSTSSCTSCPSRSSSAARRACLAR